MIELLHFIIRFVATVFGSLTGLADGNMIKLTLDLLGHLDVNMITVLSAETVCSMSFVTLPNDIKFYIKMNIQTSIYNYWLVHW